MLDDPDIINIKIEKMNEQIHEEQQLSHVNSNTTFEDFVKAHPKVPAVAASSRR